MRDIAVSPDQAVPPDRCTEVSVLHVPAIKPLDEGAVVDVARRSGRLMTSEEHAIIGGLRGAVAEAVSSRHPVPIHRHGIAYTYIESAPNEALLEKFRFSARRVASEARRIVERRP